jgi:glycosyltransferase involved in cell wall biosynthesis
MRETLTHPFKAGYDWYVKAFTFAFLMPFTKCDLMSFDAIHVPGGNFTMPSRSRVYRIPLWIDVDRIPRDVPTKFDKFTVLFSGRKAWEKGWFMFREVASKLRQKGYDFEFLCTGEGEGGIRGLGFLSEDELFCVYQRSHVVVYPSIGDVFGLVILEAATCGVPVVTTPIEAHTGQHLPVLYARSLDDFVKAVLRTYSIWTEQPDRYRAWCRNLRTSAEKYDVKKIFPLFEKMLEDTVNRRKT